MILTYAQYGQHDSYVRIWYLRHEHACFTHGKYTSSNGYFNHLNHYYRSFHSKFGRYSEDSK